MLTLSIRNALTLLALPLLSLATKYGDEQFGHISGGHFWAFHSGGVSIINPNSCTVEGEITQDQDGKRLPERWHDGIYMERQIKNGEGQEGTTGGLVLINSGVTHFDENFETAGKGEIVVFSTESQKAIERLDVGGRPFHSYGVYTHNEFWSHSDGDGHFYVVNLDDISRRVQDKVQVHVQKPFHGKLLWDEDRHLQTGGPTGGAIAYASSTGEQHIFLIDLEKNELLTTFDYSSFVQQGTCKGTHAMAFSGKNKHLYVECVGGPVFEGILEIDVSTPTIPSFVKQHENASGLTFEAPDGTVVIASDRDGSKMRVFEPGKTGHSSSKVFEVQVPQPGHPFLLDFYPIEGSVKEGAFIATTPLTGNTNRNHMDKKGNVVCDYMSCSGAKTAEDVASGICLLDEATGKVLVAATLDQMDAVKNQQFPFYGACARCEMEENYEAGECICTPFCGSCADDDYDASKSGVIVVDVSRVLEGKVKEATLIPNAGAVRQGSPNSMSPECGFSRAIRFHKRGGIYDASVAHFPTNSIQIVDLKNQKLHCAVDIPGEPFRVVYVPYPSGSNKDGLSTGAIVGIVVGAGAVVAFAGLLIMKVKSDNKPSNSQQNRQYQQEASYA